MIKHEELKSVSFTEKIEELHLTRGVNFVNL